MAYRWLYEAVCTQRPELWLTVGYMKLCVGRDMISGLRLHKAVCRHRLWLKVGYMKLFVDRDLKCGT